MNTFSKEQSLQICKAMSNKKAKDILIIDIEDRTVIADSFVICSGRNDQQVKAICDEVEEKLEELGIQPLRKDGYREGKWVVLDYGDVLVHVFHQEERAYYNLERLWKEEGNYIEYQDE